MSMYVNLVLSIVLNFLKNSNPAAARFMPRAARQRSNKFMQVAAQYNEVGGNDAQPDFHRERRLIAVPSLLEGAVAPHQGAP